MRNLPLRILLVSGVGWLTRMIEDLCTTTAWGGPFTILAGWVIIVFLSVFYAVIAVLVGHLLRLSDASAGWTRTGYRVLLIAVPPALVLAFSASLGLRTIDPVSRYSVMDLWPSVLCHFLVVFPFANLPARSRPVSAPPSLSP